MLEKLKYGDSVSARSDKVNKLIDIVSGLVDENNVHEKQIDDLQQKVEGLETTVYSDKNEKAEGEWDKYDSFIGKLCRFKDNEDDKWHYGILDYIITDSEYPFWDKNGFEWSICEVVKPYDDVIFNNGDESAKDDDEGYW